MRNHISCSSLEVFIRPARDGAYFQWSITRAGMVMAGVMLNDPPAHRKVNLSFNESLYNPKRRHHSMSSELQNVETGVRISLVGKGSPAFMSMLDGSGINYAQQRPVNGAVLAGGEIITIATASIAAPRNRFGSLDCLSKIPKCYRHS